MKRTTVVVALLSLLGSGVSHAALEDRGGGLLYDTELDVTWLQDANYAKTSGYDADGYMNWAAANTWAADLSYVDTVRGVTYDDWRLPKSTEEWGPNITSPNSEMSYMYYNNLGLKGYYDTAGAYQPDFGVFADGNFHWGEQKDVGLVKNLQSNGYWSGTAYAPWPSSYAWSFYTLNGLQYDFYQSGESVPGRFAPAMSPRFQSPGPMRC